MSSSVYENSDVIEGKTFLEQLLLTFVLGVFGFKLDILTLDRNFAPVLLSINPNSSLLYYYGIVMGHARFPTATILVTIVQEKYP